MAVVQGISVVVPEGLYVPAVPSNGPPKEN